MSFYLLNSFRYKTCSSKYDTLCAFKLIISYPHDTLKNCVYLASITDSIELFDINYGGFFKLIYFVIM